jgi:hypothetical protein
VSISWWCVSEHKQIIALEHRRTSNLVQLTSKQNVAYPVPQR